MESVKNVKSEEQRMKALKKINPKALVTIEELLKYKIEKLMEIFYDFKLNKKPNSFIITVINENLDDNKSKFTNAKLEVKPIEGKC